MTLTEAIAAVINYFERKFGHLGGLNCNAESVFKNAIAVWR